MDATNVNTGHLALYTEGPFYLTHKVGFGLALSMSRAKSFFKHPSSMFTHVAPKHERFQTDRPHGNNH